MLLAEPSACQLTIEQLFALAMAAVDDPDARVVLSDALELSGWSDPAGRMTSLLLVHDHQHGEWSSWAAGKPMTSMRASAIATVLLFDAWVDTRYPGTEMWPVAARCRLDLPCEVSSDSRLWGIEEADGSITDNGVCRDCGRVR